MKRDGVECNTVFFSRKWFFLIYFPPLHYFEFNFDLLHPATVSLPVEAFKHAILFANLDFMQ